MVPYGILDGAIETAKVLRVDVLVESIPFRLCHCHTAELDDRF